MRYLLLMAALVATGCQSFVDVMEGMPDPGQHTDVIVTVECEKGGDDG